MSENISVITVKTFTINIFEKNKPMKMASNGVWMFNHSQQVLVDQKPPASPQAGRHLFHFEYYSNGERFCNISWEVCWVKEREKEGSVIFYPFYSDVDWKSSNHDAVTLLAIFDKKTKLSLTCVKSITWALGGKCSTIYSRGQGSLLSICDSSLHWILAVIVPMKVPHGLQPSFFMRVLCCCNT